MDTPTRRLDGFRLRDERLVELTLAAVLAAVVIVAISWAIDGFYEPSTLASLLYLFGALLGFAIAVAIRVAHPLGFFGGIVYLASVIGDVIIAGSGFQGPLGIPGAVALYVLGTAALVLCRDAFFDGDNWWPRGWEPAWDDGW